VDFKDGDFAMFDVNGAPVQAPVVTSDDIPGPPPTAEPPAPPVPPQGQ